MLPLATITAPLPRAVRDIATAEGKDVQLVISGDDTELDRIILESLAEPLVHMVRNAVGHGIETPSESEAAGQAGSRARSSSPPSSAAAWSRSASPTTGAAVSAALIEEARHARLARRRSSPGPAFRQPPR